jgi:flagellar motility protein MotE (MotC chaperone)
VHAFLIGFGIYLGFVWTKNLDQSSTPSGNRAIFITYVVSASVCYALYALSNTAASGQSNLEFILPRLQHRVEPRLAAIEALSSSVNASNRGPSLQSYSTEIQQVLRESAQLKRDLATLDERIAQLLGNFENLDNSTE